MTFSPSLLALARLLLGQLAEVFTRASLRMANPPRLAKSSSNWLDWGAWL